MVNEYGNVTTYTYELTTQGRVTGPTAPGRM